MYNYQQHSRQAKLSQQCRTIHDEFIRLSEHRKNNNFRLSTNHARRVDAFMLSSMESPVKIDEYKPPSYLPRNIPKPGNLSYPNHPLPFRIKHNTAQERINDVNNKSGDLDGVPFRNTSQHKFRDLAESSKTKPIRLNSSCAIFRIYDHLVKNRTNQIDLNNTSKLEKIFRSSDSFTARNKNIKIFQKTLASDLHRKTYFNSLRTIAHSNQNQKREFNPNEKVQDSPHENKKSNNKENHPELTNRSKNATEALFRCGILNKKKL